MFKRIFLVSLCIIIHTYADNSYNVLAIGDSHIMFNFQSTFNELAPNFSRTVSTPKKSTSTINFNTRWLGARTLYGTFQLDLISEIRQYDLKNIDAIIFSFGEIDARCHIQKQAVAQNKSTSDIIDTLVKNFFETIQAIRYYFPEYKGAYIIMGIIPPIENPIKDDINFPTAGTIQERATITYLLNKAFADYCAKYHTYMFFPYTTIVTAQNTIPSKYSDGHVHFNMQYNDLIIAELFQLLNNIFVK